MIKICSVEVCEGKVKGLGYCRKHYQRFKRHGDVSISMRVKQSCRIDGCLKDNYAYGLCDKHNRSLKLYGDPLIVLQHQNRGMTLRARFETFVRRYGGNECDIFFGSTDRHGYGRLSIYERPKLATHVAWMLEYGAWPPKGKQVCHTCDNPPCVNISHLWLGTCEQNIKDMWIKGRAKPGKSMGEDHGNSKLTNEQVMEIRCSTQKGVELSKQYKVSQTIISGIRLNHSWKHLLTI